MLKAAFALLAVALIASLFAYGIIPSRSLHEARMLFFTAGSLFVPVLLAALVRNEQ